ncbi:CheR family methyltransferase [Aurantiacibacter suaedae]|uniref:CheR family methyltransferase n=1 Tax=Aurantiacibacter suaedae TaxID=2545755 RepID=UPI0010F7539C|nr:protein-glutamate O-methyltransferase CheR [Aurantiacibacter suaedae]
MSAAAALNTGEALVPGISPQVYGLADFQRISAKVHEQAGIVLSDKKRMLVYSRLAPLLRGINSQSFSDFLDQVENDQALSTRMIEALTTNHTYFNRESHHYDHFAKTLRPELLHRANQGQPVRIWSAGCSSGEEIWTLMMVLLGSSQQEGKRIAKQDIVALASDLASHAVNAGIAATYEAAALEAVPEPLRKAWTSSTGGKVQIGPDPRRLVRFRQLNLLGPWPIKGEFDVIFCRNVMIYFDTPTKEKLVWRFANQLKPGGYLYIGHSERVSGRAEELLELVGPTVYRRRA